MTESESSANKRIVTKIETRSCYKERIQEKMIQDWIDEQSKLVGSRHIYDVLNDGMKSTKLNRLLTSQQLKLYAWREDFFVDNLGGWNERKNIAKDRKWETNTYEDAIFPVEPEDAIFLDTIPFQVTTNFNSIMRYASQDNLRLLKIPVHLENSEEVSSRVRQFYDINKPEEMYYEDGEMERILNDENEYEKLKNEVRSEGIFMICKAREKYRIIPKKLKEIASIAVIYSNLNEDSLPPIIQEELNMMRSPKYIPKIDNKCVNKEGLRIIRSISEKLKIDC